MTFYMIVLSGILSIADVYHCRLRCNLSSSGCARNEPYVSGFFIDDDCWTRRRKRNLTGLDEVVGRRRDAEPARDVRRREVVHLDEVYLS